MPDETENGVPVIHSANSPPIGADSTHAEYGNEREFKVAVQREQQQENQEQRQRKDDAELRARGRVLGVFAAPVETIALRQRDLRVHLRDRIFDGAGEIAAFDGELHADVARIVLAINKRRAVGDLDVGEFAQRNFLPAGRNDGNVADLVGIVAVFAFETHDEVELLFLLHDLRRHVAADGGLDQRVDVGDVDAVARDLGAVDIDAQARLSEFLHQRHFGDAAHVLENLLDRICLSAAAR